MRLTRILVVDNRDSFVHNLVDYLRQLTAEVDVVPGHHEGGQSPDELLRATEAYDGVLLSPGPGTPEQAVLSQQIVIGVNKPILGVCLGHQVIAVSFGATVSRAPELVHGVATMIHHDAQGLFADLPNPFPAGRYHSLAVLPGTLPPELQVSAWTDEGVVMAIRHRSRPIDGVQFHPESILTEVGMGLLRRWMTGLAPLRATTG